MSFSPLFGTFQHNRLPVQRFAPDGFVVLNGDTHVTSCRDCGKKIDLNRLVTQISCDLSVDSSPGGASISLSVPRHLQDDFFQDGQLILTAMMEVEIYMKGHFLVDGQVRYYKTFWGLVTGVSEEYSGGEHTVNLQCADILHWWNIQQINMNPSYKGAQKSGKGIQILGGAFRNTHPYDIIFNLARFSYGDTMDANIYLRTKNQEPRKTVGNSTIQQQTAAYWESRWGRIGTSLRMFGMNGSTFSTEQILEFANQEKTLRLSKNSRASTQGLFTRPFTTFLKRALDGDLGTNLTRNTEQGVLDVSAVRPFVLDFGNLASFDLWQSEFQSKLEVATLVKETIGYEFYMDPSGEIIFKPPFWNLDTRANKPVSWIRDIDIISWSFSEGEPEATFIEGHAAFSANAELGAGNEVKPHAQFADYKLIAKYGWRAQTFDVSYTSDPAKMFFHLIDRMDQMNLAMNSATITIPMRAELRMGFPVYLESKDTFWYIKGLQHDLNFGGQATTTLVLEGKRSKFNAPRRLDVPSSEPVIRRDAEGKIVGVPNVVMRFQRLAERDSSLFEGDADAVAKNIEKLSPGRAEAQREHAIDELVPSDAEITIQGNITARSLFGVNADGQYIYQKDGMIPTSDNEDYDPNDVKDVTILNMKGDNGKKVEAPVFPVSDNGGYEVIGNYRYGRDLAISTQPGVFAEERTGPRTEAETEADIGASTSPAVAEVDGETGEVMQRQKGVTAEASTRDASFQIDPNNYSTMVTDLQPRDGADDCDCTLAKSKQFLEFFGTDGNPVPIELAGSDDSTVEQIEIPPEPTPPEPVDEAALFQELAEAFGPGQFGPDEVASVEAQVAQAVADQPAALAAFEEAVAAREAALAAQAQIDEAHAVNVRTKKEEFRQLNAALEELYDSATTAHKGREKKLRGGG